ncbi:MAG: type II toxin-antitoxin system RelE/ParE family toxin [Geminicoccales bacterium]
MRGAWTQRAPADLESVREHVAEFNRIAAARLVERIIEASHRLVNHPNIRRPGRIAGTREPIVPRTHYLLSDRVHGQTIEILRVYHGARRWPSRL